jgi:holin-like protein
MKIFKQIGLILLFYVIGEALSYLILLLLPHFFIPGPILGMVLLLLVMSIRWIQLKDVDEVGTFLTSNMAFFFIPAAVSVLEYFDVISPVLWQIAIVILVGIFTTFFAVVYSVKLTIVIQNRLEQRKGGSHD